MYALGHYGIALLVYAPVGYLLARHDPTLALFGGGGVHLLSTVPDSDHRIPLVTHRGLTHTLAFTLASTALAGLVGWRIGTGSYAPLGGPGESAVLTGGVTLLGLGSHILGDVLTPAGVAVLWPLSDTEYTLDLTRADSRIANWGLFAAGVVVATAALRLAAGLR